MLELLEIYSMGPQSSSMKCFQASEMTIVLGLDVASQLKFNVRLQCDIFYNGLSTDSNRQSFRFF